MWTGEVRLNEQWLTQPLEWRRPRRIFVCAHSDLFAEAVPDEWIDRIFAVMALAPRHTFLVLTKRPDRMHRYLTDAAAYRRVLRAAEQFRQWRPRLGSIAISDPRYAAWWPQIWLGATIEDQKRADARRPHLQGLAEAGWQTWASYEPALGPVDWSVWEFLRWLVSSGESGPIARASHPDWHRTARDFCDGNGIPYHFKQCGAYSDHGPVWGAAAGDCTDLAGCVFVDADGWAHSKREDAAPDARAMRRVGKRAAGRLLDGIKHDAMPPLRGQQYELELVPYQRQTSAPVLESAL